MDASKPEGTEALAVEPNGGRRDKPSIKIEAGESNGGSTQHGADSERARWRARRPGGVKTCQGRGGRGPAGAAERAGAARGATSKKGNASGGKKRGPNR